MLLKRIISPNSQLGPLGVKAFALSNCALGTKGSEWVPSSLVDLPRVKNQEFLHVQRDSQPPIFTTGTKGLDKVPLGIMS